MSGSKERDARMANIAADIAQMFVDKGLTRAESMLLLSGIMASVSGFAVRAEREKG